MNVSPHLERNRGAARTADTGSSTTNQEHDCLRVPGHDMHTHIPFVHLQPEPEQTAPQAPQLLRSLLVFTQLPLQQLVPDGQTVPQAPQLLGSLLVSTQVPLQFV
jgi:hypothetical protein